MEGFPEYAYTTEAKQPHPGDFWADMAVAVRSEGSPDEELIGCDWVHAGSGRYPFGALIAGYLAAVNRIPIFIIDPADLLGKEHD